MFRPRDPFSAAFVSHRGESGLGDLAHVDELKDCCD